MNLACAVASLVLITVAAAASTTHAKPQTRGARNATASSQKAVGLTVTPRKALPISDGPFSYILPDAPCPQPAEPKPIRLGRGPNAPLLDYHAPEYPRAARERHSVGVVILEVVIGPDGRVRTTKPLRSPDQELTEAAERAVKKWRFARTCV